MSINSVYNSIDSLKAGKDLDLSKFKYRLVFNPSKKQKKSTSTTGGTLVAGTCIGKENSMAGEALRYSKASGKLEVFYVGHNQAYQVQKSNKWVTKSFTDLMEYSIESMVREIADLGVKEYEDIDEITVAKYVYENGKKVLHPEHRNLKSVFDLSYYANSRDTYVNGRQYSLRPSSVRPHEQFEEGKLIAVEVYFNDVAKEMNYVDVTEEDGTSIVKVRVDLENTAINVVYGQVECFGKTLDEASEKAGDINLALVKQQRFRNSMMFAKSRKTVKPQLVADPAKTMADIEAMAELDSFLEDAI